MIVKQAKRGTALDLIGLLVSAVAIAVLLLGAGIGKWLR